MNLVKIITGVAVLVVGLAGCGSAAAPATSRALTASEIADEEFYAEVKGLPGMAVLHKGDVLERGRMMCRLIGQPGVELASLQSLLAIQLSASGVGQTDANVAAAAVIGAAHSRLCPNNQYAPPRGVLPVEPVAPVVSASAPTPTPVSAPAGPAATITGDGTYEVGVDIEPGKYKTPGSGQECYWARLNANGEDIIDNNFQAGPQTVTIKAGELFETTNCGIWTKQ